MEKQPPRGSFFWENDPLGGVQKSDPLGGRFLKKRPPMGSSKKQPPMGSFFNGKTTT